MQGYPTEAPGTVSSLELALPFDIGYITDPQTEAPALWLERKDQNGQGPGEVIEPAGRQWHGDTVQHFFDPPIGRGEYRVVVRQSRIRREDGAPTNLVDPNTGTQWTGWDLVVFATAQEPTPPSQDAAKAPSFRSDPFEVMVSLDGKQQPVGASELSGQVLSVHVDDPKDVQLEIRPLGPARESLYGTHVKRKEGESAAYFTATGFIGDLAWAKYFGKKTAGRVSVTNGKVLLYEPVVQRAQATATHPYVELSAPEETTVGSLTVNKQVLTVAAPHVNEDGEFSYTSLPHYTPVDPDNAPDHLQTDGLYYTRDPFEDSEEVALYDLPLNTRLIVSYKGEEVWWGQTRMIPLLITAEEAMRQLSQSINAPEQRADVLFKIWQASVEALSRWNAPLPVSNGELAFCESLKEYVLLRLALGDSLYRDGTQGQTYTRVGDTDHRSQSDHRLWRRMDRIVDFLNKGVCSIPFGAEDDFPVAVGMLGSEASPGAFPETSPIRPDQYITPVLTTNLHNRLVHSFTRNDLFDPPQYRRGIIY